MTEQHPITPSPELIQRCMKMVKSRIDIVDMMAIAEMVAQWGADQELEACCEWLECDWNDNPDCVLEIRAARRTKSPTLNSIALQMLNIIERDDYYTPEIIDTIRKALEALPND